MAGTKIDTKQNNNNNAASTNETDMKRLKRKNDDLKVLMKRKKRCREKKYCWQKINCIVLEQLNKTVKYAKNHVTFIFKTANTNEMVKTERIEC